MAPAGRRPGPDGLARGRGPGRASRGSRRRTWPGGSSPGETPAEALATVRALRRQRLAFTADLLGEAVISEPEAEAYQQTCLDLLRGLAGPLAAEPEIPQIDRDDRGPIPRANLSLKLTSLTARFDALHAEATADRVAARLRPILRTARELGAYVHVDMEQYAHKDLTYAIFRSVLTEPEFRDWPDVGIVAQAYLPETEADLAALADWAERRGTPVTVRLVKGAYWDYEVVLARQLGWPVPVYQRKWETDACYERCSRFLMEHHELAPAGLREPQRPEPGARDGRGRGARRARSTATRSRCSTAWASRSSGPSRRGATASGSTRPTARCCRAWPTWSAGSWKTRRTSRS